VFIDTYLRIGARGLNIRQVAERYASWLLGVEGPPRSRGRRLEEGVRPDWTVERLLASEPLVGDHGCRVDVRLRAEDLLVRFIHRDNRDPAVLWHAVAHARVQGDSIVLEHASGRDAPKGQLLRAVASVPRVVTGLIDEAGVEVLPRQLNLPLVTLWGDDVAGFLDHELLLKDRTVPIVTVACDRGGATPLVDGAILAGRLKGLASVALLATERSTFEFADALDRHGYGGEYKCFHGAVHVYGPTAELEEDHRLWLADSLRLLDPTYRTEALAGMIAGRLGVRGLPSGFFTLIEEHDREERRRLAERLAKRPSVPPPAASSATYVNALEKDREQLRQELQRAIQREEQYVHDWNAADDGRRAAERQRDDAEAKVEQERAHSADLREQIDRIKRSKASMAPEAQRALTSVLGGRMTPEDCLRLVGAAFPDRIIVLDSAYQSARRAEGFRHVEKLAELLERLGSEYYDALCVGKSDAEAAMTFGDAFAAKESETTMSNRRARTERTFRYENEDVVMWRHLRIGVKESTAETIRVHFGWVAERKKVVVGWCGEHRYRVG